MASQSMNFPPRIDRFQIKGVLGSGTFGQVFYALDPKYSNREVAIKIPEGHGLSREGLARFRRESQAAMSIKHPNLCRVYETGTYQGVPFIVMEYIPGHSLEYMLTKRQQKNEGPMDPIEAAKWLHTLALAIQAAHDQGVIHRDLKPGNIVYNKTNHQMIIVDFGLVKLINENKDLKLTEDGRPLGTVLYMPPEQASGQLDRISVRSDIYSLGAIFYEMICGRTAFLGNTQWQVIADLLQKDPKPPSHWYSDVPAEADAICLKAMARKPEDRYGEAREMAFALKEFLEQNQSAPLDEIVQLDKHGTLPPKTRGFHETPDLAKTKSPLTRTPLIDPEEQVAKPQSGLLVANPTIPPHEDPDQAPAAKPGKETTADLARRTVIDQRNFAEAPKRAEPINWNELKRVLFGLVIVLASASVICGTAIKIGLVTPPSWSPDWLLPGGPPPPATRDREIAKWALQEGQGRIKIQMAGESTSVWINHESGLPKDPKVEFAVLEIKLENKTIVTSEALMTQLKDLPLLQKLDLSGCPRLKHLDFLPQVPSLESLDLSDGAFPKSASSEEESLVAKIVTMPNLKALILNRSAFPSSLLKTPGTFQSLQSLQLAKANSEQLSPAACEAVGRLPQLNQLGVAGSSIGDAELEKILAAPNLRRLDLSSTALTNEACQRLAKLVKLESLNLSNCPNISGDGVAELRPLRNMRELYLNQLPIADRHMIKLNSMTQLRVLQLSGCREITNQSVREQPFEKLEELMLDGTQVNDDLLQSIAIRDAQIRHLGLANTKIWKLGAPGYYLPRSLDVLQLSGYSITKNWIDSLKPSNQNSLRAMEIVGPDFTDDTLEKLLAQLNGLEELTLRDCPNITIVSLPHLAKERTLRRIQLIRTSISPDFLDVLKQKLPNSEIILTPRGL
jgi:serine/threonine protein kinase